MIYKVEVYHVRSRGNWTLYYICKASNAEDAIAQVAKLQPADVCIVAHQTDLLEPVYLYQVCTSLKSG